MSLAYLEFATGVQLMLLQCASVLAFAAVCCRVGPCTACEALEKGVA